MTDQLGPMENSSNGRHAGTDVDPPSPIASGSNGLSVDERLDALLDTIRTWDWRKAWVESEHSSDHAVSPPTISPSTQIEETVGFPPIEQSEPGTPMDSPPGRTRDTSVIEQPLSPRHAAAQSPPLASTEETSADASSSFAVPLEPTRDAETAASDSASVALSDANPTPDEVTVSPPQFSHVSASASTEEDFASLALDQAPLSDTEPTVIEPAQRAAAVGPSTQPLIVPTDSVAQSGTLVAPPNESKDIRAETAEVILEGATSESTAAKHAVVDEAVWFGPEPEAEPEPVGWLRPFWSHPAFKLATFILAVGVIALAIIVGIRHFATNNSDSGPSLTTTTQSPAHSAHHNAFVPPITSAQLSQYKGYATALQNGNVTASTGFAKAGDTPSVSQLVLVVVAYRTAVNDYTYNLHMIQWPASMQRAIAIESAQLQALSNYLQAFASVSQSNVNSWLAQFHALTSTVQGDDNVVRGDLGLAATSSFP